MWIKDRFGHYINSDHLLGLFVDADPSNSGAYVVKGNVIDPDNPSGELAATFSVSGLDPMTQAQATSLCNTMGSVLGAFDPSLM